MVIVDTSVWVDWLRKGDGRVEAWMAADLILQHPFVTAEISMGGFRSAGERGRMIDLLDSFEQVPITEAEPFHSFVATNELYGTGIGFADAHLLFACLTIPEAQLVTHDKRLAAQADRLRVAWAES